jgi:hypothetical protein
LHDCVQERTNRLFVARLSELQRRRRGLLERFGEHAGKWLGIERLIRRRSGLGEGIQCDGGLLVGNGRLAGWQVSWPGFGDGRASGHEYACCND